jgi:hypothetical protein
MRTGADHAPVRSRAFALAALVAVCGCGASRNTGSTGDLTGGMVMLPTFMVAPPSTSGWDITVDQKQEQVVFRHSSTRLTVMEGPSQVLTLVGVYRNQRLADLPTAIDECAAERLRQEVAELNKGATPGEWGFADTRQDVLTIGDKRVFVLAYSRQLSSSRAESGSLYLYFPPGFEQTRALYEFVILRQYAHRPVAGESTPGTPDLSEIIPVIQSFQYRGPATAPSN